MLPLVAKPLSYKKAREQIRTCILILSPIENYNQSPNYSSLNVKAIGFKFYTRVL